MKRLDQRYEPVTIANQDDVGSNRSSNRPLLEIHAARLQRRAVLRGFVTAAAAGALGGTLTSKVALAVTGSPSSLGFQSIPQTIAETHAVAPGYAAEVLIRWGDPVLAGAPT